MESFCSIEHKDTGIYLANEQRAKWVTIISFVTMVVEIVAGYWTGSMSLLADGWHMASHTLALFLSVVVYWLYRHPRFRSSFTFGGGKILSLGGYTSAMFLIIIAGSMIFESFTRFFQRPSIHYSEALVVAVVGLVVNLVCAYILHKGQDSHGHGHSHTHGQCDHSHHKLAPAPSQAQHGKHHHHVDHNHAGAYVHILTDALTSLLAIVALLMGMWQGWSWLDPAVGLLGGLVVLKWSFDLIFQTGRDLLDAHDLSIDRSNLVNKLEEDGSKVMDIHLWKLSPGQIGCEIIIKKNETQKSSADYRDVICRNFDIHHLIIEVV